MRLESEMFSLVLAPRPPRKGLWGAIRPVPMGLSLGLSWGDPGGRTTPSGQRRGSCGAGAGFAGDVEEPKRSTQSSPRPSQDLLAQPLERGGELCAGVGGGEGNLEGEMGMETEAPGAELPIFRCVHVGWQEILAPTTKLLHLP